VESETLTRNLHAGPRYRDSIVAAFYSCRWTRSTAHLILYSPMQVWRGETLHLDTATPERSRGFVSERFLHVSFSDLFRVLLLPGAAAARGSGSARRAERLCSGGFQPVRLLLAQHRSLRHFAAVHIAPQGDQQLARERHDAPRPLPTPPLGEALIEPPGQLTVGLQPHPRPA